MIIERILVTTDFSAAGDRAVRAAAGSVCRYTAFFSRTNVLIVPRSAASELH